MNKIAKMNVSSEYLFEDSYCHTQQPPNNMYVQSNPMITKELQFVRFAPVLVTLHPGSQTHPYNPLGDGGSYLVQCPLDLQTDSQTHLYITPPFYLFMSYIRLITNTDNTNKPINCFHTLSLYPLFLCLLVCPRLPIMSPL